MSNEGQDAIAGAKAGEENVLVREWHKAQRLMTSLG